ncbi:MAG: dihydroorotase [Clostridia bacterium]|nr:dihydroorotase [Deltaproteobacteria bacterium]
MSLHIRGGRVVEPGTRGVSVRDLFVDETRDGLRVSFEPIGEHARAVIEAAGKLVLPGLVDLRAHLREPGEEYKEDIESGVRAALAGGVTTVVAQPDTKPCIDNGEIVNFVRRRGEATAGRVLVAGAVTKGLKGEELAPIGEMRRAGAVMLSDGDNWVRDAGLMRRALEYARDFNLTVSTHAEEATLARGGHMHEGAMSVRLGLRGIPSVAEETALARDLALATYTGGRLHVAHVTSARAVEMIRDAKGRETDVTCDVSVHHLVFTDKDLSNFDSNLRLVPPLRTELDRQALIRGLADGTIDAIVSDHAPQSVLEKDLPFHEALPGAIGLQSLLPLAMATELPLETIVARLTTGPAAVLHSQTLGLLAAGDIAIVDPAAEWQLARLTILSKCMNTPLTGRVLRGRVDVTVFGGRIVYQRDG